MKPKSIVYTNDHCIGCNKCIKVCSAMGACISKVKDGKASIVVDGSKCVACGSCIDVCEHGAREYVDDTVRFFEDLKNGEPVSLLLAPAFKANYPEQYGQVIGSLKKLGVKRIISVSFGADITTWGYLNYIDRYDFTGGISQPCPAVVGYIERYLPELLPKLFPVQSPLMCAAIYARKELGITDRLAFLSPCIAKKLEIEDPHNEGLVQYNVTMNHLMSYLKEHPVSGTEEGSEIEYGLGSFYPTPGGLAETVRWFLGDQVFIRQVEGERRMYEWLHQNADRIREEKTPFLFIDALNCEKGCICGTAVDADKSKTDDALYSLLSIREAVKKNGDDSPWSKDLSPAERLKLYNRQFEKLDLKDYLRGYTDRSADCTYEIPNEQELEEIFLSMNKTTKESREINCTCCGYESCRAMARAIHNGFNHKENCIYYEKTQVHRLEIEKAVAEEASRAKTDFLANMSHEIRTPINAILGMNEMVGRECGDGKILEYSGHIEKAGKQLLGLVNTLLDFKNAEEAETEKKYHQKSFTAPDAEILLVDDTEMNLTVVKHLLKETKVRIDTAGGGKEALALMEGKTYDLLLFDHMMPEMDGIELLHAVRENKGNSNTAKPCIVLTANAVQNSREMYIAAGFDEYMSKPVEGKALERLLMKYLPPEKVILKEETGEKNGDEKIDSVRNELGEIPGIAVETGIKNCGSPEDYYPVLEIFYKSISRQADELEDYFGSENWISYTIKVHALKSSARIIGAMELGEEAFALETAGKSGDIDFIREHHEEMIRHYRSFGEILGRLDWKDEKKDESELAPAGDDVISELFDKLMSAADSMDYDGVEEALEEAGRYSFPEKEREILDRVRDGFADIDYDKILSILSER